MMVGWNGRIKMAGQEMITSSRLTLVLALILTLISCASAPREKRTLPKEKDPQYQYELAVTAMRYGLPEEAVKYLNQALSLDSNHYPSYFLLGAIQTEKRNFKEAEAAFRRCVEIKPDSGEAHLRLAYVYQEMHQLDLAEEEYKKAGALDSHVEAAINLAKLYYDQNKLEEALATVAVATKKDDRSFPAFNLQGVILNELGRYGEAVSSFRHALRLSPESDVASLNLAAALINNGDLKEAQALLEKTLERVKNDDLKKRVLEYLEKIKELR